MKNVEIRMLVQIPLADIAKEVASLHSISLPLLTAKVTGEDLVLEFGSGAAPTLPIATTTSEAGGLLTHSQPSTQTSSHRRRRTSRRNRMKTRGWGVVKKMTNSHGQTVTIYQPFVEALKNFKGPRRTKERAVAQILRSNGNTPGRESIRYYLDNTLEYLSLGNEQDRVGTEP
jgi:hypothetical protein